MTNTSDSIRTISGRLALDTNYYTGVFYRHVDYNAFRNLRIGPGMSKYITHPFIHTIMQKYFIGMLIIMPLGT